MNVSEEQLFDNLELYQQQQEWQKVKNCYLMKLMDEYIENNLGPSTLENIPSRNELLNFVLNIYAEKVNSGTSSKKFKSTAVKKIKERFNVKYPKYVF